MEFSHAGIVSELFIGRPEPIDQSPSTTQTPTKMTSRLLADSVMAETGESSKPVELTASGINMEQSNSAALVLVIGEPFTEEHKELILDKIAKGRYVHLVVFGCRLKGCVS